MIKYSFSERVIHEWNKLLNERVNACSVNMYKTELTYISDKRCAMVHLHLEHAVWDDNLVKSC